MKVYLAPDDDWRDAEGFAPFPLTKSYPHDAGWDLPALIDAAIAPGEIVNIPTGWNIGVPEGYFGLLVGRSSTARRHGLAIVDAIIDAGYNGPLYFQCYNTRTEGVQVRRGYRLAQLLILPVPEVEWIEVDKLPPSPRGGLGMGSSGL